MITAILALLSTRWVQYLLASIVGVAALWFGVISPYNNYVSEKKVAAALVKERSVTAPTIKLLGEWVAARDTTISDIKAKSEAERLRLVAVADLKTKELGNALTQNKTFKANLVKLHGDLNGFNSVLDSITAANNNSATGTSASARLIRLGTAHTQCEKEYRAERTEHSETLGKLDEALIVIRALQIN